MDSCQIVAIIALISIILADNQSPDDLNVMGNLIVAVGSILLTIAAQESAKSSKKDNDELIHSINEQIEQLQKQLQKLK
jgi:hypothetical protein